MGMTYAESGVDIAGKSAAIKSLVRRLGRSGSSVLRLDGHYAGGIAFGPKGLILCTDGVGTKLLVAGALDKWDTVGIDCIAMNVNDAICVGARPVAFVDYLAVERPDGRVAAEIGKGLRRGAEEAGVAIVGGETAVLPEVVRGLDLAGTCLAVVDRNKIVSGSAISPGDAIIGLPGTGVHSNGLTLARKVFESAMGKGWPMLPFGASGRSIGEELLIPTAIYVRPVLDLLRRFGKAVTGLANITGGGLSNLCRLKGKVEFRIEAPLEPQDVFEAIQKEGGVSAEEMYRVFNMGMGFAVVCRETVAEGVLKALRRHLMAAKRVGTVKKGNGVTLPAQGLRYERY